MMLLSYLFYIQFIDHLLPRPRPKVNGDAKYFVVRKIVVSILYSFDLLSTIKSF